jgi:hypothetical protein
MLLCLRSEHGRQRAKEMVFPIILSCSEEGADFYSFPAGARPLRAFSFHAGRPCVTKDGRCHRPHKFQHGEGHCANFPLCPVAESLAEEVEKFTGIHGDHDPCLCGIGKNEACIFPGRFN